MNRRDRSAHPLENDAASRRARSGRGSYSRLRPRVHFGLGASTASKLEVRASERQSRGSTAGRPADRRPSRAMRTERITGRLAYRRRVSARAGLRFRGAPASISWNARAVAAGLRLRKVAPALDALVATRCLRQRRSLRPSDVRRRLALTGLLPFQNRRVRQPWIRISPGAHQTLGTILRKSGRGGGQSPRWSSTRYGVIGRFD